MVSIHANHNVILRQCIPTLCESHSISCLTPLLIAFVGNEQGYSTGDIATICHAKAHRKMKMTLLLTEIWLYVHHWALSMVSRGMGIRTIDNGRLQPCHFQIDGFAHPDRLDIDLHDEESNERFRWLRVNDSIKRMYLDGNPLPSLALSKLHDTDCTHMLHWLRHPTDIPNMQNIIAPLKSSEVCVHCDVPKQAGVCMSCPSTFERRVRRRLDDDAF